MKISPLDRQDYEFLRQSAELAEARGLPHFDHLKEPIGRWNYSRIANELAAAAGGGRLLDWGCGYGQMTYLLGRRGFAVTPFDVGAPGAAMPDVPLCRGLDVVRGEEPSVLPFAPHSFDAVLSCGVLEHVEEEHESGDEERSLEEIRRVLRPQGAFFLYYLPQRWSWQEAVTRVLKLGYSHPRRYSGAEIGALLERTGYRIEKLRRANLFPRNISGAPPGVRAAYGRLGRALIGADAALCRVPALNRVAGVLEIVARPR